MMRRTLINKEYLWKKEELGGQETGQSETNYSPMKITQSNLYPKPRWPNSFTRRSSTDQGTEREQSRHGRKISSPPRTKQFSKKIEKLSGTMSDASGENMEPMPIYTNIAQVDNNKEQVNIVVSPEAEG